jgi:hypothetical protein
MANVLKGDQEFAPVTLSFKQFCNLSGISHGGKTYELIWKSLNELARATFTIRQSRIDEKGRERHTTGIYHWIDNILIHEEENVVDIKLDNSLKPFLLGLDESKKYIIYELGCMLSFRKKWSGLLYQWLKSHQGHGTIQIGVNELKNNHKGCKGELTERVLEKLSVVYLTAKYVKECFAIEISTERVQEYIYTLESRINTETDIADKALDCILDYICRNHSKFIRANIGDCESCVDGRIIKSSNNIEISILKSVADSILSKNGFENAKTIAHKWQIKGILICEGDRTNKRVKLIKDLPVQTCYVFKLSMCSDKYITFYESVSSDKLDDIDIKFNL